MLPILRFLQQHFREHTKKVGVPFAFDCIGHYLYSGRIWDASKSFIP